MKKLLSILAVSVFAFTANAGTLDDVKNRGFLKCGVTTGLAGFAAPDDSGLARETNIAKFNIGTELRMTFGKALRKQLKNNPLIYDRLQLLNPTSFRFNWA